MTVRTLSTSDSVSVPYMAGSHHKESSTRNRLISRVGLITWGGAIALAVIFSAFIAPALYHTRGWWIFGDLSAMLNASDIALRSGLVFIYNAPGPPLVALPGFEELMVVVLIVLRHFGLVYAVGTVLDHGRFVSLGEWSLADHITVIVAFALGSATIFPIDALARDIALRGPRRVAVLVLSLGIVVWAIAVWGHPDDVLAIGLLATSLRSAFHGSWALSAWLLGAALTVQPLAVLGAFVVFGVANLPLRKWWCFIVRVAIIPVLSIDVPLAGNTETTLHHILGQPVEWGREIVTNHVTPWHALVLHISVIPIPRHGIIFEGDGSDVRILAVVLAVYVGWWVARQRSALRLETALWALALAFAGRIIFESVIVPYYLVPSLLFGMIVVATKRPKWIVAGVLIVVVTIWVGSARMLGEWTYLLVVGGGLLTLAAIGWWAPADTTPHSCGDKLRADEAMSS